MISLEDRIKGSLYGFAIGDAMGATTEFMNTDEIKALHGEVRDIIGGGWLSIKPGQVTDDTQMMLCVCEAIERFPRNSRLMFNRCCENFTNWYLSKPVDVGGCCRAVISNCKASTDHRVWLRFADNPQSLGNGSLMRTLPMVLANLSEDDTLTQGRLTHNNIICDNAIHVYRRVLLEILDDGVYNNQVRGLLEPTGHVIHTLNNAFYWVENTKSFEQAIIKAVNNGGDADTIAAITGSLVGALYGYVAIPRNWIMKLDPVVRIELDQYAKLFEKFNKKVCTN